MLHLANQRRAWFDVPLLPINRKAYLKREFRFISLGGEYLYLPVDGPPRNLFLAWGWAGRKIFEKQVLKKSGRIWVRLIELTYLLWVILCHPR